MASSISQALLSPLTCESRVGRALEESLEGVFPEEFDFSFRFADFLQPNEIYVSRVKDHLVKAFVSKRRGLLVSTGAERSFFDLILCDDLCEGLVVRDVNPRVKAYVDFIVLLLRISSTREEFAQLAGGCVVPLQPYENCKERRLAVIEERVKIVYDKLEENTRIPNQAKSYYKKNLSSFAQIYFENYQILCEPKFINYHSHEDAFTRLKSYADKGAIVATIGDIGELRFLKERVAVVDVSNIHYYSLVELRTNNLLNDLPFMIWTEMRDGPTDYFSFTPHLLTEEQKNKVDTLIRTVFPLVTSGWTGGLRKGLALEKNEEYLGYNSETLEALERYQAEFCLKLPFLGETDLSPQGILDTSGFFRGFLRLTPEQQAELICTPGLERFVVGLVKMFEGRTLFSFIPLKYCFLFSSLPGWEAAFEEEIKYLCQSGQVNFVNRRAVETVAEFPEWYKKIVELRERFTAS